MASSSTTFVVLFVIITIGKCNAKCTTRSNTSYCDTLQDFYEYNGTASDIYVGPDESNNLADLQQVLFQNANNVRWLDLKTVINNIQKNAFKNFVNLEYLFFHKNKIDTIKKEVFNNLNVKYLSLKKCSIKDVEPEAFANLTKLEELLLSGNNLTIIKNGIFNNLTIRTLTLSENNITQIDKMAFGGLPNLQELYLNNNGLTKFYVQDHITFDYLSKLTTLWLQDNQITDITKYMLEGLSNLEVLQLGYNKIVSIEPSAFDDTSNLALLILSNNNIKEITGNVLPVQGLNKLKYLYLDHNRLTFLSTNFLSRLKTLKYVMIEINPLQCPCLDLIVKWAHDNNVTLLCKSHFDEREPICVMPDSGNKCLYTYDNKYYETFKNLTYAPVGNCWVNTP